MNRYPFPAAGPAFFRDSTSSRKPMVIFGRRGDPIQGRWTSEELATQAPLFDATYVNRYISGVIPFNEDMPQAEQVSAFQSLLAWSTLSGALAEGVIICVPRWLEYTHPHTQDLILGMFPV